MSDRQKKDDCHEPCERCAELGAEAQHYSDAMTRHKGLVSVATYALRRAHDKDQGWEEDVRKALGVIDADRSD